MRFRRGDFIEVTHKETGNSFRGTAMDTKGFSGLAAFNILVQGSEHTLELSLNFWDVSVLFSADVARDCDRNHC